MPRPPLKRRRSNKQSPSTSRHAPPNVGLDSPSRVKLQQQLVNKVVGQRPQDSDDSDRLVTRTRRGGPSRNVEPLFASGGVAKGDKPGAFPTKQQRSRRLRSETEEILRRSRSKSIEAAKERERLSKSRSNSASGSNVNDHPVSPVRQTKTSDAVLPVPQPTPGGETSVLGTLRPRRRQASILHMIDNNDSSIINPEDEEQFLPDNESTPLHTRQPTSPGLGTTLATATLESASRKRKREAGEVTPDTNADTSNQGSSNPRRAHNRSSSVSLPSISPLKQNTIPNNDDDDDDIMAPPQSSSPENSPPRPKPSASTESQKTVSVPTTEQLQSLMPSKRRKGTRQRTQPSEFDIPDDSDSIAADNAQDDSVFIPRKRAARSRSKKDASVTIKPKADTKGGRQRVTKTTARATPVSARKSKQGSKSTSTSFITTVTTPRTPLPLTRNTNQENKTMATPTRRDRKQDRNPNSKPNGNGDDKENDNHLAALTVGKDQAPRPFGGSRRPLRSNRGGGLGHLDPGPKEKLPDSLPSKSGRTRASRKRTGAADPVVIEERDPSVDVVAETDLDDEEEEEEEEAASAPDLQPALSEVVIEETPEEGKEEENEEEEEEEEEAVDKSRSSPTQRIQVVTPVSTKPTRGRTRNKRRGGGGGGDEDEGEEGEERAKEKVATATTMTARTWKDKWHDIDNWDLDYEEVDVGTDASGSSSLVHVSVV